MRDVYPEGKILANVGAGTSLARAKEAIELFQADALQLHLNAPQELVMPEGDRDFSNWKELIKEISEGISVPLIVKEVGFGMTRETIDELAELGVQTIDISGRSGTSFTQIENARRKKRVRLFSRLGTINGYFSARGKRSPTSSRDSCFWWYSQCLRPLQSTLSWCQCSRRFWNDLNASHDTRRGRNDPTSPTMASRTSTAIDHGRS